MLTISEVMGATKKAKITFTCSQETRDYLEESAKNERRTLSNLVELRVDLAISLVKEEECYFVLEPITSEVMGATKKAKITFTCSQEAKDYLEECAKNERRTLSHLVEIIIDNMKELARRTGEETE